MENVYPPTRFLSVLTRSTMKFCAVLGCAKRSKRDDVKFYRFPSIRTRQRQVEPARVERRSSWIAALHRDDFPDSKAKNAFICSAHFITGQPSDDPEHPDYVPSQNMGYKKIAGKLPLARYTMAMKRSEVVSKVDPIIILDSTELDSKEETNQQEIHHIDLEDRDRNHDESTQTDFNLKGLEDELLEVHKKLYEYRETINNLSFNEKSLSGNDKKTLFLTGIPTYECLKLIFSLIEPFISSNLIAISDKFQHFLLTLMRLRLNVSFRFLSYIFNCSDITISRIFFKTIDILFQRLKCFIYWPSREELQNAMPSCFKEYFGKKTAVIIDCFEIFIEKPSNLDAQASTWSNYKHHNTIKYLIGITPYGAISFISAGYGGRISDKLLTGDCGILNNLLPGDLVLADRGFLIEDMVGLYCASVQTPAFLKNRKQLEPHELEQTRHIATVRIHVERVIGVLRQKFTILHETLPITMVKKLEEDGIPSLDKILTVCCALVNMCPSVVPIE